MEFPLECYAFLPNAVDMLIVTTLHKNMTISDSSERPLATAALKTISEKNTLHGEI